MSKINSNKKDLAYPTPKALWNVKILLQSLVVGIIYSVAMYWYYLACALAVVDENSNMMLSFIIMPLYLVKEIAKIFNLTVTKPPEVLAISHLIFMWAAFYAISLKVKLNAKTIHLTILTISLIAFLTFVSNVIMFQMIHFKLGVWVYFLAMAMICTIFVHISCVNFRSTTEVTKKEILLITIYLLFLVLLVTFFYIRLMRILSH